MEKSPRLPLTKQISFSLIQPTTTIKPQLLLLAFSGKTLIISYISQESAIASVNAP